MNDLIYLGRILFSLLLSLLIGLEREKSHKDAGLRTLMLISLGTTVFTIIPFILTEIALNSKITFDFSRMLAYTVSGICFLAGLAIIRGKRHIEGITTAACIFATVSGAMLSGLGEYYLAGITIICIWLILKLKCITKKTDVNGGKHGRTK